MYLVSNSDIITVYLYKKNKRQFTYKYVVITVLLSDVLLPIYIQRFKYYNFFVITLKA